MKEVAANALSKLFHCEYFKVIKHKKTAHQTERFR